MERKIQELQNLRLDSAGKASSPEAFEDQEEPFDVAACNERPVLSHGALYSKQGISQLTEHQFFGASSLLSSIEADGYRHSLADKIFNNPSIPDGNDNISSSAKKDDGKVQQPWLFGFDVEDEDLNPNIQAVQAQLPPPEVIQLYIDT